MPFGTLKDRGEMTGCNCKQAHYEERGGNVGFVATNAVPQCESADQERESHKREIDDGMPEKAEAHYAQESQSDSGE